MADGFHDARVVTIGGGTGGFVVNSGLRAFSVHATAICTVFDSGGSTGVLRDEFGALPQGDIRRCMLALMDDKDHRWRTLFNHRFANSNGTSGLSNHSLGNLLLLGSEQAWGPIAGLRNLCQMFNVRGEVLPISLDKKVELCAMLDDGTTVVGESHIDFRSLDDTRVIERVWLEPSAIICREAADAIMNATHIVLGPGDLYTSIIPNLKVEGVPEAISRSKAKLIYVANLMTKWSETRNFELADFLRELERYDIGRDQFDAVLVNCASIPHELVELYAAKDKSSPVRCTAQTIKDAQPYTKELVQEDFLNRVALHEKLVRHDSYALARAIVRL
jgi:uncharacterized cofD-like protein